MSMPRDAQSCSLPKVPITTPSSPLLIFFLSYSKEIPPIASIHLYNEWAKKSLAIIWTWTASYLVGKIISTLVASFDLRADSRYAKVLPVPEGDSITIEVASAASRIRFWHSVSSVIPLAFRARWTHA